MIKKMRAFQDWDNDSARAWWQTNLTELTGSQTLAEPAVNNTERMLVLS